MMRDRPIRRRAVRWLAGLRSLMTIAAVVPTLGAQSARRAVAAPTRDSLEQVFAGAEGKHGNHERVTHRRGRYAAHRLRREHRNESAGGDQREQAGEPPDGAPMYSSPRYETFQHHNRISFPNSAAAYTDSSQPYTNFWSSGAS